MMILYIKWKSTLSSETKKIMFIHISCINKIIFSFTFLHSFHALLGLIALCAGFNFPFIYLFVAAAATQCRSFLVLHTAFRLRCYSWIGTAARLIFLILGILPFFITVQLKLECSMFTELFFLNHLHHFWFTLPPNCSILLLCELFALSWLS